MEARLEAAQRGLIWLLVVTVGVLLVCVPRPGDARVARAFAELSEFERNVNLPAVERTRHAQAMHFAQVSLSDLIAPAVDARGSVRAPNRARGASSPGTKWRISENAPALLPLASLKLATLADVSVQSQGATQADVGLPQAAPVKSALTHRLARLSLSGVLTITGAVLEAAELGPQDVERELEAERLRLQTLDAQAGVERAERKLEVAQKRVDVRKKRRSRSLDKFREQLLTATTQRDEKASLLTAATERYEAVAEQAARASEGAPAVSIQNEIPAVARLRVALEDAQGNAHSIALAVALERRQVSLPPLVIPGASGAFSALRATQSWEELRSLSSSAALAAVSSRLSWQSRRFAVLGFPLEGSWLLQVLPCLVLLALLWAAGGATRATTSYRLFSTEVRGSLRRVGFDKRGYELVVVVLLPLATCILAAVSLWLLRRLPVLPAVAFTISVPLALRLFAKLDELRVLNRSIAQYHSYPPPSGSLISARAPEGALRPVEHGLESGAV